MGRHSASRPHSPPTFPPTQGLSAYEEALGCGPPINRPLEALSGGCLAASKLASLATDHAASQLAQIDDYVAYMPSVQVWEGVEGVE